MIQTSPQISKKQVGSYPKIAAELSGRPTDIESWEKGKTHNELLLAQSHVIASKMDGTQYFPRVRKKTYSKNLWEWSKQQHTPEIFHAYDHNQDLTLFGLHSEEHITLPNFRNISIIPYVARKKRQKAQKQLEYFLQENPNCRMWTITGGTRCTLSDLEQRIGEIHAKFGRVNQQRFMKRHGASFVFRATEFGQIKHNEDNNLTFHPHVHAVLKLERMLRPEDWKHLILSIKAYFVYHSQDCGRIRDTNELVKYCSKPNDLQHLTGCQLIEIHQVTTTKRLYEFLGDLRKQRSHHNEENLRIIRRKGKLKTTLNWVGGVEKLPLWVQSPNEESDARPTLVAWTPPASIFTHITEPCFIVHALGQADPKSVFKWFEVKNMKHAIKVHTKTLTHHNEEREKRKEYESKQKIFKEATRIERIPRARGKPNSVLC